MKPLLFIFTLVLATPLVHAQQTQGSAIYASAAPVSRTAPGPGLAPAAVAHARTTTSSAIKGFIEVMINRQVRQVAVKEILMVTPTATGCKITLSGPAPDFDKTDNTAAVDTSYGQVLAFIQQAQM